MYERDRGGRDRVDITRLFLIIELNMELNMTVANCTK